MGRVKAVLPPEKPGKRGRPRKDDRRMLNGMLWIVRSGMQWRELPGVYGPWQFLVCPICQMAGRWYMGSHIPRIARRCGYGKNLSLDSTCIKVHESANGGGKNGR